MPDLGNLLIVGVQKAGTTSLHDYLSAHVDIQGAVPKEPGFYLHHGNDGERRRLLSGTTTLAALPYASMEEYASTFGGDAEVRWRLDSSTPYFQSDFAREQVRRLTPQAAIIICLREPAARAYSAYNWAVKQGWETAATFEAALDLEEERRQQGYWFSYLYTDTSLYSARVAKWLESFPNCKVVLFDDLQSEPLATVNGVLDWLGLAPFDQLDAVIKNPSGLDRTPVARALRRLANRERRQHGIGARTLRALLGANLARRLKEVVLERLDRGVAPPPTLAEETRTRLAPLFEDDRRRLEVILDRDLSAWGATADRIR